MAPIWAPDDFKGDILMTMKSVNYDGSNGEKGMKTKRYSIKTLTTTAAMVIMLLLVSGLPVVNAATESWDISLGNLVITSGGSYTVTGSSTSYTISINTSDPVAITLDNVSIDVSAISGNTAFDSGGNVTLYLIGSNTLKSSTSQPGIRVIDEEQLTVSNAPTFKGTLSASGGAFGAGIGGGYMQNGGAVTINGGSLTANGGDFAAGIGGAYTGNGGDVTITGGTVTANGGLRAAGIGGGIGGSGGDVVITGGSIKAAGVRSNIGAGYNGSHDGTLTNGFVPVTLSTIANAVAANDPMEVSYQIPLAGNNPYYNYAYIYTGTGHGGGDTNLYFYLPPSAFPTPSDPTGLTATAVSSSQINLTWIDSDTTEQGFKIERCLGAGCSDFTQIATVDANVIIFSNTGLTSSTTYSYRVRAYNASGDSSYSNTASAVTQGAPVLPAAPTNLTALVISKNQINLFWTDNADNETGFRIERCKGSTCTNFTLISTVGVNVSSYSNTKLTANTTYRYRVIAYNANGNSGYSNIAKATTRRR
jgi:hypothetical protein